MPDGMAKSPNQPNGSAKNRQSDKYFPEIRNDPDHDNSGEQPQTASIATAITGMAATTAAAVPVVPINRDVFPWSCMNMSYTHNYPPKRCSCSNGGADGDRTRKQ